MLVKRLLLMVFALCLVVSCGREKDISGEVGSPEYVAELFFLTLFEDQDVQKAAQLANGKLSRIMLSYGSARQYTRSALNLSFDTIKVEIDRSTRNVRQQYDDVAKIRVMLSGTNDGEKVDDMRVLVLTKRKGKWFVDKVEADKFL